MSVFKVYASKYNEGGIIGATVVAYDGADKTIEKIIVLDADEVTAINEAIASLEEEVDGKAPLVHTHDDRYYTETEIDSTVTSLEAEIDSKAELEHTHDDRYYTESEIDSKITVIETELDGKADSSHNHDTSYYTKSEVDSELESLESSLDSLVGFTATVVASLPETGESGVMYLVLAESGVEGDVYNEYIWVDTGFEKIGSTATTVDLSGYVTDSELTTALADKADKTLASTTADGLMSSADKTKLDGLSVGAGGEPVSITVDSALSSISENPVQNKVIKAELDSLNTAKANTVHSHADSDISVTTTSYGEDISQEEYNKMLSYDMINVKGTLEDKLDIADFEASLNSMFEKMLAEEE